MGKDKKNVLNLDRIAYILLKVTIVTLGVKIGYDVSLLVKSII